MVMWVQETWGLSSPRSQEEREQDVLRLSFSYQCKVMGRKASKILPERPCVFPCAVAFHCGYIRSMSLEFLKRNQELCKNMIGKEPEMSTSSPWSLRKALPFPEPTPQPRTRPAQHLGRASRSG